VLTNGLGFSFSALEALTGTLKLYTDDASGKTSALARVVVVGSKKLSVNAGSYKIKIRLNRKGKAILRKHSRLKVTIRGTLTGSSGKTTTVKTTVTLKRKPR
jgi:hypothetical protein